MKYNDYYKTVSQIKDLVESAGKYIEERFDIYANKCVTHDQMNTMDVLEFVRLERAKIAINNIKDLCGDI